MFCTMAFAGNPIHSKISCCCRSERRIRRQEREDPGAGQSSSAPHGRKSPVAGSDSDEVTRKRQTVIQFELRYSVVEKRLAIRMVILQDTPGNEA